jgi:hypothetical protein
MTGTAATSPPQRRPVIRAVSFDEAGEAIGRLLAIAMPATRAAETGVSSKVADFLLAWWNGLECGHFPVLHLCNLDAVIAEDMLTIMAYLAQEPTIYPARVGPCWLHPPTPPPVAPQCEFRLERAARVRRPAAHRRGEDLGVDQRLMPHRGAHIAHDEIKRRPVSL